MPPDASGHAGGTHLGLKAPRSRLPRFLEPRAHSPLRTRGTRYHQMRAGTQAAPLNLSLRRAALEISSFPRAAGSVAALRPSPETLDRRSRAERLKLEVKRGTRYFLASKSPGTHTTSTNLGFKPSWSFPGPPGASSGFLWPPGASWGILKPPGLSWSLLGRPGASWGFLILSDILRAYSVNAFLRQKLSPLQSSRPISCRPLKLSTYRFSAQKFWPPIESQPIRSRPILLGRHAGFIL